MRYFQADNRFAYLFAREGFFDGTGYLLCEYVHCCEVFVTLIEDVVYFLFGDYQRMSLYQWIDIKKSKKTIVFRYLVARNFACDDSTEYCCHNL